MGRLRRRPDGLSDRPGNGRVTATVAVGRQPVALAVQGGSVWVALAGDDALAKIDGRSGQVVKRVALGKPPGALATLGDAVWATTLPLPRAHRGGTLRVDVGDFSFCRCVDPAIAFDLPEWSVLDLAYDGLVAFRRVGGAAGAQLVGDLAISVPRPSADGRTYVFRLRPGVRFADGQPVRASDVRASFERLFAVNHVNDPPGWYDIIVGADRCGGRRCDLSRGIAIDDRAGLVTFHLRRADPDFLYRLALPFAFVLPPATPAKILKTPVAGTGPYRIAAFVPGHRMELVRNERFRAFAPAAAPDGYPDRIEVDVTKQDDATVRSVLGARATLAVDVRPSPTAFRTLAVHDPVQLHADQRNETTFMFLNTRVAPFDDARARRAVDYAVDRARVAQLRGGPMLATPTCQILPPDFPGYRPYCPYTVRPNPAGTWIAPDTARARALVTASGTRGQKVVVWGLPDQAAIVQEVARELRAVGYQASGRTAPGGPYYARVEDSRRRTQIGVIGWTADYPSGANMLQPLFACSSFVPADPNVNNNASELCDPAVERDISAALRTQRTGSPDPAGAWTRVDRRIVDVAAAAPLVNDLTLNVASRGVGDYRLNPQWGPLLDQLWVR